MNTAAHARTTDPTTSHAAAASVRVPDSERARRAIRDLLAEFGPMTDVEIAWRWETAPVGEAGFPVSPSGLRTRRAELVARGEVEDTGRRERLESGRQAIVWGLVEQGSAAA